MREFKRKSRDDKSTKEDQKKSSESYKKKDSTFSPRSESSNTRKTSSRPTGKFNKETGKPSFNKDNSRSGNYSDRKPFSKDGGERPFKSKSFSNEKENSFKESKGRSYIKKDAFVKKSDQSSSTSKDVRPFRKRTESASYKTKSTNYKSSKPQNPVLPSNNDGKVRLNRYIANSGICSRRKADELIEAGVISVNNEVVSELGLKVDPAKDIIKYNGALLKREKKVYVLLNKPKDYITTTEDPQERKTVMHLVEKASRERIYPVGRLDRNTTGLLLMTNDGDLADKLSHPKNGITKIYQVELNRNLSQGDLNKIQFGLELEDGLIKPDSVSYVTGGSKKEIGIQIHSGKNRIVRRIFEHLGYEVVKLDRVVYGNLTKKDLPRGRWRYLDEHELIQIKHLIK
ncbi:pseudouridine synthase [Pedobacter flavus]|uniref:Pseudouridine synthase n=1 Tax=Pedobacter flavus TaxID=3113906 RepID=A0ABU7GYH8_9SPHI|nr:pseudouridine synthase [Pedobacter sp. VNH31]MEE1884061.1 pseudouridine synthase [Pedobacter sp. VNH31]